MTKFEFTESARQDLKALDRAAAQRILKKLLFFTSQLNPLIFAKKLTDRRLGSYRFRIGDYRVVFDVKRNGAIQILLVLRIKHRKDVYGL